MDDDEKLKKTMRMAEVSARLDLIEYEKAVPKAI
jgi:hypothetical protein